MINIIIPKYLYINITYECRGSYIGFLGLDAFLINIFIIYGFEN